MMFLYIFFIVCLWNPFQVECVDYCDIESCGSNKKEHIMCKYPDLKPKDGCEMIKVKKHKARILATHNKCRNDVACGQADQPPASNMKRLTWDSELEEIAEHNVMSCEMEHDKCRDVPRFSVGQNLLMASELEMSLNQMEDGWYGEKKDFKGEDGIKTYASSSGTGHYTQMVWANSQYIGCAMAKKGDNHYMACNYGPAGNMIGGQMYKIGKAASACDKDFKKDAFYKGLCNFSPSISTFWFLRTLNLYVAMKLFL